MIDLIPSNCEEIKNIAQDRKKIAEMRDGIRHRFSEFFNIQGFRRHEPGHIIPEHDQSVLFTGSTISTFKPYLIKNMVPAFGYYMIQSCLRTQNTKILNNHDAQPQWASYFSSTGALTQYKNLDEISEQTWGFFTDFLGIPSDRMAVRIASKDRDLLSYWEKAGLTDYLEYDANQPDYYTHKFGMGDISGRNCNLAIIDLETGELKDIGNIIVIERSNKPVGVEIAFGVETIVSRILGYPNPIAASLMADIVPVKNRHSLKLADAISSSMIILETGERPVATNRGRVLRKYLQSMSALRHKAKVSIEDIREYAEEFEVKEFGSYSERPEKISKYLMKFESLKEKGLKPEKINANLSSVFPPKKENEIAHEERVSLSSIYGST